MAGLWLVAIVIAVLGLLLVLRVRFFQLLLDIALGTLIYLSAIFLIGWFGINIPLWAAEWGYPCFLVCIILYHLIISIDLPRHAAPLGGL